jgi:predicted protein tyrosine phosphatase
LKILFVCSQNRLRSPTAEAVFSRYPGVEASSAGTSPDAETHVSPDLIDWADLIFVMESVHRSRLNRRFGPNLRNKRIIVLGIPDEYDYMEPDLIAVLKRTVTPYLRVAQAAQVDM